MRATSGLGRSAAAIAVLFFVNGAAFGSWVPRIPTLKERLALDISTLGFVLLGAGLGGLAGSVVAGWLVDRLGSRRSASATAAVLAVGLPVVALAPSALSLAAVLFVLGALDAVTDVAMNAQAVAVEGRTARSVMNRFHAAWSLGTVTGSAVATSAAAAGVGLLRHLGAVAAVEVVALAWAWPRLLAEIPAAGRRRWAALSAPALALGAAGLAVAVVEGTAGDWSAVFASEVLGVGPGPAGATFVALTVAMLAGRLAADPLVDRLGPRRLLLGALGTTAAGVAGAVTSGSLPVMLAGFMVAGAGISVLFPSLYGAAGRLTDVGPGVGIATMSFGARIGFLVASPVVGLLGGALGLRAALAIAIGAGLVFTGLLTTAR